MHAPKENDVKDKKGSNSFCFFIKNMRLDPSIYLYVKSINVIQVKEMQLLRRSVKRSNKVHAICLLLHM